LVEAVESGAESEIIIARNGKPAAKLVAVDQPKKGKRKLGMFKGEFPDFTLEEWNASDPAVAKLFGVDK
jgi:antitoxin (DNA-binding transcriptional repressor) of toxin-antitoxin stability system